MTPALTILAADPELAEPVAAGWQLVLAALAGIAVIVVLITIAKLHPFLALIFGGLTVGIVAQGPKEHRRCPRLIRRRLRDHRSRGGRPDRIGCDVGCGLPGPGELAGAVQHYQRKFPRVVRDLVERVGVVTPVGLALRLRGAQRIELPGCGGGGAADGEASLIRERQRI